MDYLKFYGLKIEPFSNAPVNRFYYNSKQHSLAMTKLLHAVSNMRGLAVVEGEIGTGKTTLARRLLENLPEKEYVATLLVMVHSEITAQWLLKRIVTQLGVEKPMGNKLHLLSQLYRRLVEIYKEGKKAVVLIDEAQMLKSREIMEEFRGMLNLEVPERKLITFVMFGLPELSEYLKIDQPLQQRVAMRLTLQPLDLEATGYYIIHRLRVAGARKMFFTVEAIRAIHYFSGGNPRLINTICDNALLEGAMRKQPIIDRKLINRISKELKLPLTPPPQQQAPVRGRESTDIGTGVAYDPSQTASQIPQPQPTYPTQQPAPTPQYPTQYPQQPTYNPYQQQPYPAAPVPQPPLNPTPQQVQQPSIPQQVPPQQPQPVPPNTSTQPQIPVPPPVQQPTPPHPAQPPLTPEPPTIQAEPHTDTKPLLGEPEERKETIEEKTQIDTSYHKKPGKETIIPTADELTKEIEKEKESIFSGNLSVSSKYNDEEERRKLIEEMDRKLGLANVKEQKVNNISKEPDGLKKLIEEHQRQSEREEHKEEHDIEIDINADEPTE